MQTIVLYLCYIVLILLFSYAYTTSLIYCFVIWSLHTNKRRPCSSTLSGHPSSSWSFICWDNGSWFCCAQYIFSFRSPQLHTKWLREGGCWLCERRWKFQRSFHTFLIHFSSGDYLPTFDHIFSQFPGLRFCAQTSAVCTVKNKSILSCRTRIMAYAAVVTFMNTTWY